MELYKKKFKDIPIGFSEIQLARSPSIIAAALGAKIIEKHLTIRRDLWGADHKTSSTPEEFKEMVDTIRKIETDPTERERWLKHPKFNEIYGNEEKKLTEDEIILRPFGENPL